PRQGDLRGPAGGDQAQEGLDGYRRRQPGSGDDDDAAIRADHSSRHDSAPDRSAHHRGAHDAAHHRGEADGGHHRRPLMLTSLAHTAVCVPDVEEAVRWYRDVLGLTVIWSPVLMESEDIERDMGELIPAPVAVKGAILGVGDAEVIGDRVLEVIQYQRAPGRAKPADAALTDHGYSHVGL